MTAEGKESGHEPVQSKLTVMDGVLTSTDIHEFMRALQLSKRELEVARQQFDNVIDSRLIDHVVFRLGAAERHFSYLLQLARQWNISTVDVRWDWPDEEAL